MTMWHLISFICCQMCQVCKRTTSDIRHVMFVCGQNRLCGCVFINVFVCKQLTHPDQAYLARPNQGLSAAAEVLGITIISRPPS